MWSISVDENQHPGTIVTEIAAEDPEGAQLSFSISSDFADIKDVLEVDANGNVRTVGGGPDYEIQSQYVVVIAVSDHVHDVAVTLEMAIRDTNDPPEFDAEEIALTLPIGLGRRSLYSIRNWISLGTVTAVDREGDDITYEIVAGNPSYYDGNIEKTIYGLEINDEGELLIDHPWIFAFDEDLYEGQFAQEDLRRRAQFHYSYERTTNTAVDIRATDSNGNWREKQVMIQANPEVLTLHQECGSGFTKEQWKCRTVKEIYPPKPTTTASDRDTLPGGLHYNRSQYDLMMRDEFNGTELDESIWTLDVSKGGNREVSDGKLIMNSDNLRWGGRHCEIPGTSLTTRGKLEFTYGYLEIAYTHIPYTQGAYIGHYILSDGRYWGGNGGDATLPPEIAGTGSFTLKDNLTIRGLEIDIFEYFARQFTTADFVIHYGKGSAPAKCVDHGSAADYSDFYSGGKAWKPWHWSFRDRSTTTPTIFAMEWTPSGYRIFLAGRRVPFVNYQCSETTVGYQYSTFRADYGNSIIARGVSHAPQNISLVGVFRYLRGPAQALCNSALDTTVEIDYVRLWQPRNNYSDVTKIYR